MVCCFSANLIAPGFTHAVEAAGGRVAMFVLPPHSEVLISRAFVIGQLCAEAYGSTRASEPYVACLGSRFRGNFRRIK